MTRRGGDSTIGGSSGCRRNRGGGVECKCKKPYFLGLPLSHLALDPPIAINDPYNMCINQ